MDFNKINRIIYETLESIAPIETSRVSMFDIDDKYHHPPFLRFRFKNKKKEDQIYKKIKAAINSFEGNLKWKLITKLESENFLILPCIDEIEDKSRLYDAKAYYISLYGESSYREKMDKCIDDIPELAKVIGSAVKSSL